MKQKTIIKLLVLITVVILSVTLIVLFTNNFFKKNNGIPYGVYSLYENDSIIETSSEYMWIIDSECTYLYSQYEIVEKNDGLYFSNDKELIKFEYNEAEKILTVYYPADDKNNYTEEILVKKYKRK